MQVVLLYITPSKCLDIIFVYTNANESQLFDYSKGGGTKLVCNSYHNYICIFLKEISTLYLTNKGRAGIIIEDMQLTTTALL